MQTLRAPLAELADFDECRRELKKPGVIEVEGCADPQKLHMIDGLSDDFSYKIIATYDEKKAREIYEDYRFYDPNTCLYPAKDLIFYQADVHGNLQTKERIKALKPLLLSKGATIVTTFDALMNQIVPLSYLEDAIVEISESDTVDLKEMAGMLTALGYERNYQVENEGQFSIRGGIIDVFPLTEENPIRIELWGDEIDSIRSFDILSQRSLEKISSFVLLPAAEAILTQEEMQEGIARVKSEAAKREAFFREQFRTEEAFRIKTAVEEFCEQLENYGASGCNLEGYLNYFYEEHGSLLDYFDKEKTLVILDEPTRLYEKGEFVETEFRDSMEMRLEKGYVLPGQVDLLYSKEAVFAKIEGCHTLALSALQIRKGLYKAKSKHAIIARAMNTYNNSFSSLVSDLKRYQKNHYRVLLLSASRTRAARLCDDLRDHELSAFYTEDLDHEIKDGEIMVAYGRIRQGFEYPMLKFVVISESDIFTAARQKKKTRKKYGGGQVIRDFSELKVGDYVVHEVHGLGIYRGIEQVCVDKVTKDYMKIEYRDGGNLYIPATALDTIQKYASKETSTPKINKLGGSEWIKTKRKVRDAVDVIATDLVELYAARNQKAGYEFSDDTVWQTEFEERFPFEETEDQLAAIEDTKRDMQSRKIMDRLICGDVGYGKTEIAIRAAFKAVQDGKQVAYLVPTTVLAQQHYNTFVQRMKDYPVRIDMLSRFRTPSEQKKTVADLHKGMVDIVIGTHRLLSADVSYKDLGLLIIDEEQRFGVTHKEKIKKLKENVDVLTLTATPIPRTLHMSLVGIRDMSVLEEAPQDRMPIQTYVMEYSEEMVREAIGRELSRGGQVFYVYNRVQTIADMTASLRNLIPEANIAYAHGQMKEQDLERIMFDFVNGEIDVLVSTTIIETGLDISNVNTMIVHDSDKMGLAQLYQLRGRVGRSNRTAYAFLMYKKDKVLKEVAEKRLRAIREFTELGSGFKIAMRDLEIRGAGNLLGSRQSGHMEAVGYDMYCKMLNDAIRRKQGAEEIPDSSVSVELDVDAFIPESYIMNEHQKIEIYKRIAGIESEAERADMEEELTDRFGVLPHSVINLLDIAYLKVLAQEVYITEIKGEARAVKLSIYENARYRHESIGSFIASYKGRLILKTVAKPYFILNLPKGIGTPAGPVGATSADPTAAGSKAAGEMLLREVRDLLVNMREIVNTEAVED
ncbi:MAG: transcription-repair coupling factor [Lachnospiraceae bacterium]|nr:transcription-repair coupling factor [Lachnospiraceae bacterium]